MLVVVVVLVVVAVLVVIVVIAEVKQGINHEEMDQLLLQNQMLHPRTGGRTEGWKGVTGGKPDRQIYEMTNGRTTGRKDSRTDV